MKPRRDAILLALLSAILMSPHAASQNNAMPSIRVEAQPADGLVDASDPHAVADLMRKEGYRAEVHFQPNGAAEIETSAGDVDFWLYFQACDEDFTGCEIITFSAGFDFSAPQIPDILGSWNALRYSKAYLDESGDPFVEFSVNMVHGVTSENFINTLHWFALEIGAFMDQIGWNEDDATLARPI